MTHKLDMAASAVAGLAVGLIAAALMNMHRMKIDQRERAAETAKWEAACDRAYEAGVAAGVRKETTR